MFIFLLLLGIFICLCAEAFFSSSEIAVISTDRAYVRQQAGKGSKTAKLITELLRKPEWFLGTTLLGTNLSTVTAGALATMLVIEVVGKDYEYLAIAFVSPLILIFAEILPKTIAQAHANRYAERVVVPLFIARKILFPFVWMLAKLSSAFTGFVRFTAIKRNPLMTREDLDFALRSTGRRGGLKKIERQMISRIFEFHDITIDEVMIPLIEVIAVPQGKPLGHAVELSIAKGLSRLPVYADRIDNIVGVLHASDVLNEEPGSQRKIDELMRRPFYVPASKPIKAMLVELNQRKENMAIVVDEYGGAVGIVTFEDILEEVVGEIDDEYDVRRRFYQKIGRGLYVVDARIEIDKLNDLIGINLPDGDYDTLAGFLLEHLHAIPSPGYSFEYQNYSFLIKKASERAIEEVQIRVLPASDATDSD